jgi:hypothetical protein
MSASGQKPNLAAAKSDFRSASESGLWSAIAACRFRATNGHRASRRSDSNVSFGSIRESALVAAKSGFLPREQTSSASPSLSERWQFRTKVRKQN